jgi:hypothetical protein
MSVSIGIVVVPDRVRSDHLKLTVYEEGIFVSSATYTTVAAVGNAVANAVQDAITRGKP